MQLARALPRPSGPHIGDSPRTAPHACAEAEGFGDTSTPAASSEPPLAASASEQRLRTALTSASLAAAEATLRQVIRASAPARASWLSLS